MAVYFEQGDIRGPAIPYRTLAPLLFTTDQHGRQQLVPFLGAGASIGMRPAAAEPPVPDLAQDAVDQFAAALGISGSAERLLELATKLALRIAAREKANSGKEPSDPFKTACDAKYPPSASELAAALAHRVSYDAFERPRRRIQKLLKLNDQELVHLLTWIADLTEIGPSVPPLLSVASYCQYTSPATLLQDLLDIFKNKATPTRTHWLVARAAEVHLEKDDKDYLIVTTNYDSLMETALKSAGVPYCVLTAVSPDSPVDVQFSLNMRDYLNVSEARYKALLNEHSTLLPKYFTLDLRKPVAIVFKLHGGLSPDTPNHAGLVLSDEDYIRYLMQMQDGALIPSEVSKFLQSPGFLFLGYSFSDWNVRAIYKSVVKKRPTPAEKDTGIPEPKDYAVVREFSPYESTLCRTNIHMLITDLASFARSILSSAPTRTRRKGQRNGHD